LSQIGQMVVIDSFGRDEAFSHLCQACADMLTARTRGHTRVADLTQLFASYLVEKYSDAARERSEIRGGLPIRQLHKVEDYVSERLAPFQNFRSQHFENARARLRKSSAASSASC
jgi:hypothetical protein